VEDAPARTMKRLIDWLHFRYGTQPAVFQPGTIEVNPATAAAYQLGYGNGVTMGMAQGELKGRQELAAELEMQYGIDAREDLDPDAVRRIRARQVH
jgi:hypothetical protein